jgi:hypothetical protein
MNAPPDPAFTPEGSGSELVALPESLWRETK